MSSEPGDGEDREGPEDVEGRSHARNQRPAPDPKQSAGGRAAPAGEGTPEGGPGRAPAPAVAPPPKPAKGGDAANSRTPRPASNVAAPAKRSAGRDTPPTSMAAKPIAPRPAVPAHVAGGIHSAVTASTRPRTATSSGTTPARSEKARIEPAPRTERGGTAAQFSTTQVVPVTAGAPQAGAPGPKAQGAAARTRQAPVAATRGTAPSLGAPTAGTPLLKLDVDDLQGAFDRIVAAEPTGEGTLPVDPATEVRNAELFAQIAAQYSGPIREFMMDLCVAETGRQWLEVVRPAAAAIRRAAVEMGNATLGEALKEYEAALEAAANGAGALVRDTDRRALLDAYGALVSALPGAFELGTERDRRETILVHQLLLQVPGVHKVTIDRVYAAGVNNMRSLCRASADELEAVAGISPECAEAIVLHFRAYWSERTQVSPEAAVELTRKRLDGAAAALERAHEAFAEAEADEDATRKRNARREKHARILEINVLLAQLGEVDLVRELERYPVRQKVERLRRYVSEKPVDRALRAP